MILFVCLVVIEYCDRTAFFLLSKTNISSPTVLTIIPSLSKRITRLQSSSLRSYSNLSHPLKLFLTLPVLGIEWLRSLESRSLHILPLVGFLTECPRLKWSCPIELRAPHLLQTFLRKTHRFFYSSYSHIFTLGWRMQHPVFGSMVLYKYSERPSGRGGGEGGAMGETFIFCYK